VSKARTVALWIALTVGGWTVTGFEAGRLGWFECDSGAERCPDQLGAGLAVLAWPIGLPVALT